MNTSPQQFRLQNRLRQHFADRRRTQREAAINQMAEEMLRDLAFVLHHTRCIEEAIRDEHREATLQN